MTFAIRSFLFPSPPATGPTVRRWPILLTLGGLSLVVYWVGLVLPYNFITLQIKPLLDIAKLTKDQPIAQAGFVLTFGVLFGLYYLAWRLCRGAVSRAMWTTLLASVLIFNLSMLWLYPIGAADLFDNIVRGRITAQYGGNPFYEPPRAYPRDPFYPYAAWRRSTSAYGPLWELLAAETSHMVSNDKTANVLGFKLLGMVFYAGCIACIARILRRHAPERTLQGVCLFAWNPLVIYETAGNGHNDIALAFFILFGLDMLLQHRFTLASLSLTAGVLVKFIPLLLLPIALTAGFRAVRTWRERIIFIGLTGLVCAGLIVAVYLPFWRGGDPLALNRRARLFTTSLPALMQVNLAPFLGEAASKQLISRIALTLTGFVAIYQARQVWRQPLSTWFAPVQASAAVLLFYLLVTCLWFQPWYVIWPLSLAAILPEGALARMTVLLSYAALWKPILFDFFLVRTGPPPPRQWRETLIGPATLGPVWLYAGYAYVYGFFHRRAPAGPSPAR